MFESMVSSKFILPLDAFKELVFKMHFFKMHGVFSL